MDPVKDEDNYISYRPSDYNSEQGYNLLYIHVYLTSDHKNYVFLEAIDIDTCLRFGMS